ncbi:MAG: hypothetical protein NVS1B2_15720 [Vulcanimicrobiaceae bacterium]
MATFTPDAATDAATFTPDAAPPTPPAGGGGRGGRDGNFGMARDLWIRAGGNPDAADLMAHVAMSESGGTSIANATGQGEGIWQINPQAHGRGSNWLDPMTNARKAVALYNARRARGQTGLEDWEDSRLKGGGGGWGQYDTRGSQVATFTPDGATQPPPIAPPPPKQKAAPVVAHATPPKPDVLQPARDFFATLNRPIAQTANAGALFTPDGAGGHPIAPLAPPHAAPKRTFETPANARPSLWRQATGAMEIPMEVLGAWGGFDHGGTRSGKPEFEQWRQLVRAGKLDEAERLYSPFADEQVKRYAEQNPGDPLAQLLAKNGLARGIGTIVGEWYNPSNLVPGVVLHQAVKYGGPLLKAMRTASPAFDVVATQAEAAGAKAAGRFGEGARRAGEAAGGAALDVARKAGYGVGSFFDRYHGLKARGGNAFAGAGFAAQAAPAQAEHAVVRDIRKLVGTKTLAQKLEIQRLSYVDENGDRLHKPDVAAPSPAPYKIKRFQATPGAFERDTIRGGTYVSPAGTRKPSVNSLKWWMSASMDSSMRPPAGTVLAAGACTWMAAPAPVPSRRRVNSPVRILV